MALGGLIHCWRMKNEECDKNVNEEKSDAWGEERLFFISTDIIGEKIWRLAAIDILKHFKVSELQKSWSWQKCEKISFQMIYPLSFRCTQGVTVAILSSVSQVGLTEKKGKRDTKLQLGAPGEVAEWPQTFVRSWSKNCLRRLMPYFYYWDMLSASSLSKK